MSNLQVSSYADDATVNKRHRRAVLLEIVGPVAAVGAILLIVSLVTVFALSSQKVNAVASFMSLVILIPMVVMCLVPYVLLVAMAFGVRRVYLNMSSILQTTRNAAHSINVATYSASRIVTRPFIAASQRIAWLEEITSRSHLLSSGRRKSSDEKR